MFFFQYIFKIPFQQCCVSVLEILYNNLFQIFKTEENMFDNHIFFLHNLYMNILKWYPQKVKMIYYYSNFLVFKSNGFWEHRLWQKNRQTETYSYLDKERYRHWERHIHSTDTKTHTNSRVLWFRFFS